MELRLALVAGLGVVMLLGCRATIPDRTYQCGGPNPCPDGFRCDLELLLCVRGSASEPGLGSPAAQGSSGTQGLTGDAMAGSSHRPDGGAQAQHAGTAAASSSAGASGATSSTTTTATNSAAGMNAAAGGAGTAAAQSGAAGSQVDAPGTNAQISAICSSCAPVAQCVLSVQGAMCVCPATHKGDGRSCEPDASCATLACDAHAMCVMPNGPPQCECIRGWTGNGQTCQDLDECAAADRGGCNVNAYCQNTPGSRTCTCKPGFMDTRGDGTSCVDKCLSAGCAAQAKCALVNGNATCTCNPGYVGDGKTCRMENPCSKVTCDARATCTASGTTAVCRCNPGYMGDGYTCTPQPRCGDGQRNGSEQCDDRDLDGASCVSLGRYGGTLLCDAARCVYDTSLCTDPPTPSGGTSG